MIKEFAMKHFPSKTLPVALAAALSFGVATAQTSSSPSSTSGPAANSSTSATGGRSSPMAQPGKGTRNNSKDKLARADRKFIENAAKSGLFEVQVAKLAESKATDPAVKDFAKMLVDQHTNANNELTQLANSKGVELPAAPGFMKRHRRGLRQAVRERGGHQGPREGHQGLREGQQGREGPGPEGLHRQDAADLA
jgi:putative membrane protein